MSITLAFLAGVVLLLPGITGLTFWNLLGTRQGARRPDVQLTSITALFVAVVMSIVLHMVGYSLIEIILRAAAELKAQFPTQLHTLTLPDNPYATAIGLAVARPSVSPMALDGFLLTVGIESLAAAAIIASEGLALALDGVDLRSQGWVFQHIVRPAQHGFRPIAYVLTLPVQGEYGIGYEGVIADIRQGSDGEVKLIGLAEPQRFIYRVVPVDPAAPRSPPGLVTSDREWLGGVVALEAAVIWNIVVHNVPSSLVDDVDAQAAGGPE